MKFLNFILPFLSSIVFLVKSNKVLCTNVTNICITFSVSSGTGCAWMCNYCANNLGTNNYYFTDNICSYQSGVGCVGNPIAGNSYTCCSA